MAKINRSLLTIICVMLVIRSAGDIFQPALSYIAEDLGITRVEATTNITIYFFCMALSFLLFGSICDRYPKNRLLQLALAGCFLGSLLCGSATHVMMFNIGRALQAFATGLALLSAQIWIGNQSDKKTMMSRLAWFSIVVTLAPIFAPMVGGVLSDLLSWRYNFWLLLVLCLVGLLITTISPLTESKPDISTEATSQLSPRQLLKSYGHVLRHLPILSFAVCVQILYLGQSIFSTIASFLFINEFGFTASQLGILCGMLVVGMVLGRFPALFLQKRFNNLTVFLCNEALVILSAAGIVGYYLIVGSLSATAITVSLFLQAVGFSGLAILTVNNVMLVSGKHKGAASGIYNFMNQAVSLLGVLLAQGCYHWGVKSIDIFKYMSALILLGTILAIVAYLRVYSKYQHQLQ